jgi:hypothetical protein
VREKENVAGFIMPEIEVRGTPEEQKTFLDIHRHYIMAEEDLTVRMKDWDKKDELFRSYINEKDWPYRSLVFDPRTFTAIYEKTARLLANKPRGRVIPREGGDVVKAKIINELLSFQWDDNERADSESMIAKWAMMDQNTRKYGASFGLAKWHWKRQVVREDKDGKVTGKSKIFFDGPNFRPLNNRDCLPNPSYSQVKNWFQHREYLTLEEMTEVNDSARSKPIYKNLDILKQALKSESRAGGDTRSHNYVVKNLSIKGLTDYLGQDEVFKTVEVITEYRPDRWITFAPRHGVVLRDIPNPYEHGQIPVVTLKYYQIDDDIYGLSEIEPIERLQKAVNALINQYIDAINMSLYAPLKVRSTGGAVQMHTLEFGPGAKWLMNDPSSDVLTHDQNLTGVQEFTSTYRFLISAMQEALGETSAGISNLVPGEQGKTATEVKDTAMSRSARDNFNQLFLGEALKKQMMFWHLMDQQLFFKTNDGKAKVLRIVGKDALAYFKNAGLDGNGLSDTSIDLLSSMADENIDPADLQEPLFPVETPEGMKPKMEMDDMGQMGSLLVEPADLAGTYDYIPDVGSMNTSAIDDTMRAKAVAIEQITKGGIGAMIAQEGKKIKISDMAIDYWEDIGFKNADQYIENAPAQLPGMGGQDVGQARAGTPQAVAMGGGNVPGQGMGAGGQAVLNGQAQPVIPRPV